MSKEKNKQKHTGRGLSLYNAVSLSIDTNEEIARRAGYKGNTIYSHFQKPDLDFSILVKYGKAIPYDFSIEYPELAHHFKLEIPVKNQDISTLKLKLEEVQQKYTNLLEVHNELFKNYSKTKEELNDACRKIDILQREVKVLRKK